MLFIPIIAGVVNAILVFVQVRSYVNTGEADNAGIAVFLALVAIARFIMAGAFYVREGLEK